MQKSTSRVTVALCILVLVGISVEAQGQEQTARIPGSALEALFQHFSSPETGYTLPVVIETDRFPQRALASRVASNLGRRAGLREQVIFCSEDKSDCRISGGEEKRVLRLLDFERVQPGQEIHARVVVSTQFTYEDGTGRLFPAVRRVVIERDPKGHWSVTSDELLTIS